MQQKILSFLKKAMATIMSIIASISIFGGGEILDPITSRPEENTITAYDNSETVADYILNINPTDEIHDISDLLYGIFFEDINFAADGGLYAEMVVNRSFEYTDIATDDAFHGYSRVGNIGTEIIRNDGCLNENNPTYLVMTNTSDALSGIANRGFLDGMAITENAEYDFSIFAKAIDGYSGKITVRLISDGNIVGETVIDAITSDWAKYEATITSSVTDNNGVTLEVLIDKGSVAVDMVSLFPETYKGHGMRIDLAQKLEDLTPAFLRFPGGCIIEGWDDESAYNWKDSIGTGRDGMPLYFNGTYGDVAGRKYGVNLWTDPNGTEDPQPSFMSYGLGFYEYFQLAEDLGAIGVPVINCGIYCQLRGQGGLDTQSPEFKQYVQDMHDLVEFCRGDENTTWGKVRVALGHPEPFELKYICIGNEQEGDVYFERYELFLESFNEAKANNPELYDGLELIYSSGSDDATSGKYYSASYEYAKDYITSNGITADEFAGATDHHYYNEPDWFFKNADHYDEENYSRDVETMTDSHYGGAIKVFVGEYAARSNKLEAALAEAAYMTGLERNGDIVVMAAYAPLFGNLTATHWAPDLIWFNNELSTGSINYYMQKLFSNNPGDKLVGTEFLGAEIAAEPLKGKVGLGTWWTQAEFDNVKVVNNKNGLTLAQDKFSLPTNFWWKWQQVTDGDWNIKKGKLQQTNYWHAYNQLGAISVFGDEDWSNYTYTFEATKLEGGEGFLIPFLYEDENNMIFWNIGGWENTKSAVQIVENGIKTEAIPETATDFTVETGRTYEIKIVVSDYNIKGYIDGELQFDYNPGETTNAECYQVVSTDEETGDIIIKLVNRTDSDRVVAIDLGGTKVKSEGYMAQVKGNSLWDDNYLGAKEACIMEEYIIGNFSEKFNYTIPQYSATVLRLHTK